MAYLLLAELPEVHPGTGQCGLGHGSTSTTSTSTASVTLSADANCCSFSDRNLNCFSAGVVDAGVDGVAVDDDAGVAGVW